MARKLSRRGGGVATRQIQVDREAGEFGKTAIGRQDIEVAGHGGRKPYGDSEIGSYRCGGRVDAAVFEHGTPRQLPFAERIEHDWPKRAGFRDHRHRKRTLPMRSPALCANPFEAINGNAFTVGRPHGLLDEREIDFPVLQGSQ